MASAPGTPVPPTACKSAPTALPVKGKKPVTRPDPTTPTSSASEDERKRKRPRAHSLSGPMIESAKRPYQLAHTSQLPVRRTVTKAARPVASKIESLPTEILEQIFLLCLQPSFDLGLVHSSHRIAARLSNPYIYREYCKRSFFHARDREGVQYVVQLGGRQVWDPDIVKGRDQALRCKWMTFEYFESLKEKVNRDARAYVQSLKYLSQDQKDFKCTKAWPTINMKFSHVPAKLLRTPITQEKTDFLNLLAQAGTEIDTVNSCASEDVSELWQAAVIGRHWPLIRMLMSKPFSFIPNKITLRVAVMAVHHDPSIIWNIHTAIMEKEGSLTVYHGEWCKRHFPYTDPEVMTALDKSSGEAPNCWELR